MIKDQSFRAFSALEWAWVAGFLSVLIWSGISPFDRLTWWLEVFPALIGGVSLLVLRNRFRFSQICSVVILVHCWVLMVGGKYTYAHVPLFDWIRDAFGFKRNSYDGVGHFFQGFGPAFVVREVLIRKSVLKKMRWLPWLVFSMCLAISALYELFEWATALAIGQSSDEFLGTQGDPWDTQKDMALAGLGSWCALLLFSKVHNRQIESINYKV